MSVVSKCIVVLVAISVTGSAAASSAKWSYRGKSLPVRDDRLTELNTLFASAKLDPVLACDKLLPDAEQSGRFENGSSVWTGAGYQEADVVKFLKDEACGCKARMAFPEEHGAGLGRKWGARSPRAPAGAASGVFSAADIDSADAATLAFVADSFMQPTAISEAAAQRLPVAIKTANREVLSSLYADGDRAVMDARSHPTMLVGNTWVKCFDETRFTSFSIPRKDGPSFEKLLEARRVEVSSQERSRVAEGEDAARRAKEAEELAAARQTAQYWADQLGKKLWRMTDAVNRASELETGGYRTRARDQAWPVAKAAEQELCAAIVDLKATAPRLVSEARETLVRDIAYRQGDRPAGTAGALLDRYLKGECSLFGR